MIKYVNLETWELLTEKQLFDYFINVEVKEFNNYSMDEFRNYVNNCMSKNNGTLEEVEKVTEENIRHMLVDGYITQETADTIIKLDLYSTKDGSFYTTDERYFYNVDDLNTIND